MFNNVGRKIKTFAKVSLGIHIFLAFAAFVAFLGIAIAWDEAWFILYAFLAAPITIVVGVVNAWFIYAFGNITTHICKEESDESKEKMVSFDSFN